MSLVLGFVIGKDPISLAKLASVLISDLRVFTTVSVSFCSVKITHLLPLPFAYISDDFLRVSMHIYDQNTCTVQSSSQKGA